MSLFAVRPLDSSGPWTLVQADQHMDAARLVAKRCKVAIEADTKRAGKHAKRVNMPRAYNVAGLRKDDVLGELTGDTGCSCSAAVALVRNVLGMFDLEAPHLVKL